jgi:multidrug efflux pump
VLTAVFVPVAFLGGLVGELYRQFAVTIALSVAISGFVALSLTPALCATLLKEPKPVHNRGALWFTHTFERITARYSKGVVHVLRHAVLATVVFAVMVASTFGLYRISPHSFVPPEDLGYAILALILPDAASLSRTERSARVIVDELMKDKSLDNTMGMVGFDALNGGQRTNTAAIYIALKPWSERSSGETPAAVIKRATSTRLNDGVVLGFEPPPIIGLSNTGGFSAFLQSRTNATPAQIDEVTRKFLAAAAKRPELAGVSSTYSASVPQIRVELDREKTRALGVKVSDVFQTLQTTFGALYVNDFNRSGRVFQVQMQSEPRFRAHPDDIRDVYLRSGSGESVPLTALVHLTEVHGPEVVQRFNVFPAADIFGQPAPGYSSGQALTAMEEVAANSLPAGYALAWSGSYLQEKNSSGSATQMYVLGIVMAFLVLAAQYERWTLPFVVILAVPFAAFGAFLAIFARGLENDIFFQIGMITLIGLSAKNSVLIVEFALHRYQQGASAFDAAVEAARLRFRPIVMTSLAFILGVLPLAVSTGAGSNARHSIATGVIGGMLAATFIATFFVPLFFVWLMGWHANRAVVDADTAGDAEPL